MARNNGGGAAILGMLIGGVIGAGLALLFTPVSGEEARRRIRSTSTGLRDRTADLVDDGRDRLSDLVEDSRERVNEMVTESRAEISQAVSGLRGVVEEGKRAYEDRREELHAEAEDLSSEHVPQAAPSDETNHRNGGDVS
jgi:gas vesicle protein